MKSKWMILGLATATTTGVVADDCCPPSCTYTKDCIDCVAFTAPFYDMQCDWGAFLTADFLYWYGSESNLDYAVRLQAVLDNNENDETSFTLLFDRAFNVGSAWKPGLRVGIGWSDDCDGWDYYLHWTWYRTERSVSTSVAAFEGSLPSPNNFGLIPPWTPPLIDDQVYEKIKGKWEFRFNSIDLETGRRYWLSKCFTLRPFVALRGTWTDTDFRDDPQLKERRVNVGTELPDTAAVQVDVRYENSFWGVGFLGGLQPTWHWSNCFSMYGGMDVALLWGEREVKKKTNALGTSDNFGTTVNTTFSSRKSSFFGMQAVLDTAIGLRYEDCYCDNHYRFALDAGWEHHIWFNHNKRFKTAGRLISQDVEAATGIFDETYIETWHDVAFGGFVLRVRFDF